MRRLDHKRELVEYFKKNLAKNYTEESLKFALMNQGYSGSWGSPQGNCKNSAYFKRKAGHQVRTIQ